MKTLIFLKVKSFLMISTRSFDLEDDPFDYVRGESETLAGLILELTGEIPTEEQDNKIPEFHLHDRISRQKKNKGNKG